ncbi:MAG TPA: S41 family peptidase [Steroidobacteraceae bacterium]|nr:S41 family peptidase [Steroidobacteraceae bacterium]
MNPRLSVTLALAIGAVVGFGVARLQDVRHAPAAAVVAASAAADVTPAASGTAGHRLIDEVVGRIRREYVETVPETAFDEAAVKGIVARLDPHSAFLDAEQYDEMRATTTGSYSGVGIEVSAEDGRVVVVTPIEGSPAARAGVRAGDVVLAVDGQPVTADRLEETIGRMRGRPGTLVRLAVGRAEEPEPLVFALQRGEVHVHTVRAERLPGDYGYVRITQFSDSTPTDLLESLSGLMHPGGGSDVASLRPLHGLVLDLRGNPGGVLESAVSVADAFLERGLIVRADGRTPESRFEMSATPGDALGGEPLVVLVDGGSASGSEIVAGALRDHGRAALMGERTFGKGSVQTVIPLRDGQALKLTTSRYYTPAGTSIHEKGIDPDIVIRKLAHEGGPGQRAAAPLKDPAVLTALQYLRDRGLGTHYAAAPTASAASAH